MTLSELLAQAGVSRNAFYSLARRDSILPRSLCDLSTALDLAPSEILVDETALIHGMQQIQNRVERIMLREPGLDRENVRHTLLLLQEAPIERLRRALRRART